jgi:hypothetical protein
MITYRYIRDMSYCIFNFTAKWGRMSKATHRSLYPQERDGLRIIQKVWCAPCPVYCCWGTAVCIMNDWIKRKFTIRVNRLHWEFYSQGWCQLLCLSVLFLSVSLCSLKVLKLTELKLFCNYIDSFASS